MSREEPRQVSMERALDILVVMACRGLLTGEALPPAVRRLRSNKWLLG